MKCSSQSCHIWCSTADYSRFTFKLVNRCNRFIENVMMMMMMMTTTRTAIITNQIWWSWTIVSVSSLTMTRSKTRWQKDLSNIVCFSSFTRICSDWSIWCAWYLTSHVQASSFITCSTFLSSWMSWLCARLCCKLTSSMTESKSMRWRVARSTTLSMRRRWSRKSMCSWCWFAKLTSFFHSSFLLSSSRHIFRLWHSAIQKRSESKWSEIWSSRARQWWWWTMCFLQERRFVRCYSY